MTEEGRKEGRKEEREGERKEGKKKGWLADSPFLVPCFSGLDILDSFAIITR